MSSAPSIFAAGLAVLLCFSGPAAAYVIDGDLSDWLRSAPQASADDWTPFDGIKYQVDDDGKRYLNPGWGGQAYDAEAIYVALDEQNLYVAVVTGLAPGTDVYPAGDILIDGDFDLGGGPRSFDVALVVEDRAGYSAGDLVQADSGDWRYGLWNGPKDVKRKNEAPTQFYTDHPTILNSGTLLGDSGSGVQLYYGAASYAGTPFNGNRNLGLGEYDARGKHRHYVIEALIPRNLLELDGGSLLGDQFLVHWNMQCNNDFVEVDPPTGAAPVPPSWVLLALGFTGFMRYRRGAVQR